MGKILKGNEINMEGEIAIKHSYSQDLMRHNTTTTISEASSAPQSKQEAHMGVQTNYPQFQQFSHPVSSNQTTNCFVPVHQSGVKQQPHTPCFPAYSSSNQKDVSHSSAIGVKAAAPNNSAPVPVPTAPTPPTIKKTTINTEANTREINDFLANGKRLSAMFKKTGLSCPNAQQVWIDPNEAGFFYIVGVDDDTTIDIYPSESAFSKLGITYVSTVFNINSNAGSNKVVKPARALLTNFGYYQVQSKGLIETC